MTKITKIIIGVIIIILIIGGIWYTLSRKPAEEETIRIGFIAPLTGPFADWGRTIKEGLQIALQDTGHKFVVDYQDSVCDPQQTVTIANKFFNIDNIKIVIGPGCVTGLRAIAPIAEQKGALLFSTGLLDDQIFEDHQNVINLATQISTEAKYMAKYLSSQNVKRVAIVHGTNFFGVEYGKRLPESLQNHGIEVTLIEPSDLNTRDFKTIILKIMNTNPEVIFIHQGEMPIGIFAKQIREIGYEIPIYSYYASETQSVIEAGGEALEGMRYTYPVNSAEGSAERQEFETRYANEFGEDKIPSATSFFVYDGMMLLDKAMDLCEPSDTECIANFFKEFGEYTGISGDMKFEKDGSLTRPFGIKKIENGEFIWVTKEIEL